MQTSIARLHTDVDLTSEAIMEEISFLSKTLELLRDSQSISNEAYLDAGSVQGRLSLMGNLLSQGIELVEIKSQLSSLSERAVALCNAHPGLDEAIENRRQ